MVWEKCQDRTPGDLESTLSEAWKVKRRNGFLEKTQEYSSGQSYLLAPWIVTHMEGLYTQVWVVRPGCSTARHQSPGFRCHEDKNRSGGDEQRYKHGGKRENNSEGLLKGEWVLCPWTFVFLVSISFLDKRILGKVSGRHHQAFTMTFPLRVHKNVAEYKSASKESESLSGHVPLQIMETDRNLVRGVLPTWSGTYQSRCSKRSVMEL